MQKENIFIHKILPILSILLLASFLFISSVNASIVVGDVNYPDLPEEYSELDYTICSDGGNTWLLLYVDLVDSPFISGNRLYFYNSSGSYGDIRGYLLRNDAWVYNFSNASGVNNAPAFTYFTSSVDILKDNEIFFQRTPVTLAEILEVTNPTQTFQKMMKSVVVSLLVCLVGFLSFRKAWAFLKTQMKAS